MTLKAIATAAIVLAASSPARADNTTHRYAIVVGSNPGGEGQQPLQFAEQDARNFASVLEDMGGYAEGDIELLAQPSAKQLRRAVARVSEKISLDAGAGRQTLLVFYYSGHARAKSLNLGSEELDLEALRASLEVMPATLKVVILDACQSGSFSNVKGVEPAADFSHNSIDRLASHGMVVMASSSSTELSQESEKLGASYFSHYLIVGLRGAGDTNTDGQVTLDEAYRYAYNQTLVATARTAVGKQHVTYETDLKGKGEVPLTYPSFADARLELPAKLQADVLVQHARAGTVVAEVQKAKGSAVTIALPTGSYSALVRVSKSQAYQCDLELRRSKTTVLSTGQCEAVSLTVEAAKGAPGQAGIVLVAQKDLGRRWAVEVGGGFGVWVEDEFTDRLEDFGFRDNSFGAPHYSISVGYRVMSYLDVVGNFSLLGRGEFRRDDDTSVQDFTWSTHGFSLMGRARTPVGTDVLTAFAEAGIGLARATTDLDGAEMGSVEETFYGYALTGAVGLNVMPWDSFGFTTRLALVHAPVIENLIGDTHDSGGTYFSLGFRGAF